MPAKAPEADPLIGVLLKELDHTYRDARVRRIQAILSARAAGLTYGQIGQALGISEVAVRGLAKRASLDLPNGEQL